MNRKEMLARLKKGEDPLEVSILKWQDIANGKDMEMFGTINCALCQVHQTADYEKPCVGCPIYEKTGVDGCEGTPYEDYETEYDYNEDEKTLKALAKKELEFLKSLRKEVEE